MNHMKKTKQLNLFSTSKYIGREVIYSSFVAQSRPHPRALDKESDVFGDLKTQGVPAGHIKSTEQTVTHWAFIDNGMNGSGANATLRSTLVPVNDGNKKFPKFQISPLTFTGIWRILRITWTESLDQQQNWGRDVAGWNRGRFGWRNFGESSHLCMPLFLPTGTFLCWLQLPTSKEVGRSLTSLIARQKRSDSPANLFVTKRLSTFAL